MYLQPEHLTPDEQDMIHAALEHESLGQVKGNRKNNEKDKPCLGLKPQPAQTKVPLVTPPQGPNIFVLNFPLLIKQSGVKAQGLPSLVSFWACQHYVLPCTDVKYCFFSTNESPGLPLHLSSRLNPLTFSLYLALSELAPAAPGP